MAEPSIQEKQAKREYEQQRRVKHQLPANLNFDKVAAGEGDEEEFTGTGVTAGDEAAIRRRLGKERLQSKKEADQQALSAAGGAAGATTGAALGQARFGAPGRMVGEKVGKGVGEKVGEKVGEGKGRGLKSRWQQIKNQQAKTKRELDKIKASALPTGLAQQAAQQAVQRGWTLVHEFLEDTAFSFVDFMILSGPATLFVFIFRIFGSLTVPNLFTIKVKGMRVSLLPSFTIAEFILRASKTVLIGVVVLLEWLLFAALIYMQYKIVDAWYGPLIKAVLEVFY